MIAVKCSERDVAAMSEEDLRWRVWTLDVWPVDFLDSINRDPRCGCAAPDGICEWDDVVLLGELLAPMLKEPLA